MTNHITIPRALLEQALAALTHEGHFPWANKQYFVEAIRAELAKPTQEQHVAPERKPMSDAEKTVLWLVANSERYRLSRQSFLDGVDSAEAFHGIKKGSAA